MSRRWIDWLERQRAALLEQAAAKELARAWRDCAMLLREAERTARLADEVRQGARDGAGGSDCEATGAPSCVVCHRPVDCSGPHLVARTTGGRRYAHPTCGLPPGWWCPRCGAHHPAPVDAVMCPTCPPPSLEVGHE